MTISLTPLATSTLNAVRQMARPGNGQSLDVSAANANGLSHVAVVNDDGRPAAPKRDYLVHLGNGGIYPVAPSRAPYRNYRGTAAA